MLNWVSRKEKVNNGQIPWIAYLVDDILVYTKYIPHPSSMHERLMSLVNTDWSGEPMPSFWYGIHARMTSAQTHRCLCCSTLTAITHQCKISHIYRSAPLWGPSHHQNDIKILWMTQRRHKDGELCYFSPFLHN